MLGVAFVSIVGDLLRLLDLLWKSLLDGVALAETISLVPATLLCWMSANYSADLRADRGCVYLAFSVSSVYSAANGL